MKVNQTSKLVLGTLAALFTLTACTKYVDERNKEIETTLAIAEEKIEESRIPDTPLITDTVFAKNDIWLGSSSIKVTEGDPLPSWAEKNDGITLAISEQSTLSLLAQEITDLTGITVRLDDLKAENAIPSETVPVNYSGKLSGLLNYMSNRFGVWWRYKGGVITFFTKETRVFTIYALPTETSMSADLKGATMGENSGGGSASTSLSTKADLSLWESIEAGVKQALGKDGTVTFSRPTGTATVTASPHAMRKVADYINNWNEKMSRQVAISVKLLTVSIANANNYGLDLGVIFDNKTIGATFLSPSGVLSTVSPVAGGLSMALLDADSKWKGSNAIIEALSTQGKTSMVTSSSVTTLNNKVAPVQVTTSQNYVKETTVTTTGSGSDATTESEIDTDTLNYGFSMEILPRILDHGRLIMLFSMTLTDLVELKSFSSTGSSASSSNSEDDSNSGSGSGSSNSDDDDDEEYENTTVQLPKMRTRGFIQEIAMRSGSTLVLTGFEQVANSMTTAGIGQPRLTILGGDAIDERTREVLVILITPEVLESPLSPETRMRNF